MFFLAVASIAMLGLHAQPAMEWGVKAGVGLNNYRISAEGVSAKANPGTKMGFFVGGVNNFWFNDKFGLQTELMYDFNGTRISANGDISTLLVNNAITHKDPGEDGYVTVDRLSASINFHSLRLPIMVKFRPAEGLSVMAGPYVSFRMATGVHLNGNAEDLINKMGKGLTADKAKDYAKDLIKDNIKKFDVGAAMGVEYAFKSGLFIDLHYNISLMNSLKKDIDASSVGGPSSINVKKNTGVQPTVRYSALQLGVGFRF